MKLPGKPVWIDSPAGLSNLVDTLRRCPQVAVDTESNSLYAYSEQVCLVQFSTPEKDYLVDPLALGDLSPLAEIFANPEIEKIFHAAEYDVICLRRDFGFTFNRLFDTMQAARILGRSGVGLAAMLEEQFGLSMNKRFQRANWGERPLPAGMLDYASMDTHYLIALRERMFSELQVKGLWELAEEDFRRVANAAGNNGNGQNGAACWRLAGNLHLTHRQAAALNELCRFRDELARRRNVPPFRVMQDEHLLALALAHPRSRQELRDSGLPERLVERYGAGILQALEKSMNTTAPPRQQNHRLPDDVMERQEALKQWRKDTARGLGVESDVVLPKDVLEELAARFPRTLAELEALMASVPWRYKTYGTRILDVLNQA